MTDDTPPDDRDERRERIDAVRLTDEQKHELARKLAPPGAEYEPESTADRLEAFAERWRRSRERLMDTFAARIADLLEQSDPEPEPTDVRDSSEFRVDEVLE